MSALVATAVFFGAIEFIEYGGELGFDIFQGEEFFVQLVITTFAVPRQAIEFAGQSFSLYYQANGIRSALW